MQRRSELMLAGLVLLNVGLQVFDGLATYAGLRAGMGEGNPLLLASMRHLGTAQALVLFKLEACAALALIWAVRRSSLAAPALIVCAAVYLVWSVGPWTAALAELSAS